MNNQQRGQGKGGGGSGGGSPEDKNVAFSINALHRTYQAASDKTNERDKIQFKWTRRTAVAAITYTVLTAALLAAGIWSAIQATNAVNQAAQAVGEARRSADAAIKSVEAAQAQVAAARDTEQRQLMAYVGITHHGIEHFGEQNQLLRTTRRNYGATPAIDMVMYTPLQTRVVEVGPAGFPITQFPPILCVPAPKLPNSIALFPTQELRFDFRGPFQGITKEQVDKVRSGSHAIMVWGAVFYKDIFDNEHCTRYCWSFSGQSMGENDGDLCAQHNDTH